MNSETEDYRKLAVLFPGIGYHCDKPLLYYSQKLARQKGYEIIEIHYDFEGSIPDVKNNKELMLKAVEEFTSQAKAQLETVSFGGYGKVLFVGKSIGTAVAARIAKVKETAISQIVFTPIADTLENIPKENVIVFHGLADPWCENEIVESAFEKTGFELCRIEAANHSLETGDAMCDIEIIANVMRKVQSFFA